MMKTLEDYEKQKPVTKTAEMPRIIGGRFLDDTRLFDPRFLRDVSPERDCVSLHFDGEWVHIKDERAGNTSPVIVIHGSRFARLELA